MATFSNPAFPNCSEACDRCGSPLLPGNVIRFEGVSHESGQHVKGAFGPDCIYHVTGKKNPNHMFPGITFPDQAKREARATAAEQSAQDEAHRIAQADITRQHFTQANAWIIAALEPQADWLQVGGKVYPNNFCAEMIHSLRCGSVANMISPRAVSLIAGIYAKQFGRGGSKKYCAAEEEFYQKAGIDAKG